MPRGGKKVIIFTHKRTQNICELGNHSLTKIKSLTAILKQPKYDYHENKNKKNNNLYLYYSEAVSEKIVDTVEKKANVKETCTLNTGKIVAFNNV